MNPKRFLPLVAPLLLAAPLAHAQVDCSKPGGIYAIDLRDFEHAVVKVAKEDDGKVKIAQAKEG